MFWTYRAAAAQPRPTGSFIFPIPDNGLEAWFDESHGIDTVGTNIIKWTSRVNSHFVTQSVANAPQYTKNAVNGRNTVSFIGSSDWLTNDAPGDGLATLATGSADFTIFMVAKSDDSGGTDTLIAWGEKGNSSDGTGITMHPTLGINVNLNPSGTTRGLATNTLERNDNEFHIISCVFGGAADNWQTAIDGIIRAQSFSATDFPQDASIDIFQIGREPRVSGNMWVGDISEIIIYNRALGFEEVAEVEDYLFDKYFKPETFDGLFEWFKPGEGVVVPGTWESNLPGIKEYWLAGAGEVIESSNLDIWQGGFQGHELIAPQASQRPTPNAGGWKWTAGSSTVLEHTGTLATSTVTTSGSYTAIICCSAELNGGAIFGTVDSSADNENTYFERNGASTLRYTRRNAGAGGSHNDGTFTFDTNTHVFAVEYDGDNTLSNIYVDGVLVGGPHNAGNRYPIIDKISIGAVASLTPSQYTTGTYFEIILCTGSLDAATILDASNKLLARYA